MRSSQLNESAIVTTQLSSPSTDFSHSKDIESFTKFWGPSYFDIDAYPLWIAMCKEIAMYFDSDRYVTYTVDLAMRFGFLKESAAVSCYQSYDIVEEDKYKVVLTKAQLEEEKNKKIKQLKDELPIWTLEHLKLLFREYLRYHIEKEDEETVRNVTENFYKFSQALIKNFINPAAEFSRYYMHHIPSHIVENNYHKDLNKEAAAVIEEMDLEKQALMRLEHRLIVHGFDAAYLDFFQQIIRELYDPQSVLRQYTMTIESYRLDYVKQRLEIANKKFLAQGVNRLDDTTIYYSHSPHRNSGSNSCPQLSASTSSLITNQPTIDESATVDQTAVVEHPAIVDQSAVVDHPAVVEQSAVVDQPAIVDRSRSDLDNTHQLDASSLQSLAREKSAVETTPLLRSANRPVTLGNKKTAVYMAVGIGIAIMAVALAFIFAVVLTHGAILPVLASVFAIGALAHSSAGALVVGTLIAAFTTVGLGAACGYAANKLSNMFGSKPTTVSKGFNIQNEAHAEPTYKNSNALISSMSAPILTRSVTPPRPCTKGVSTVDIFAEKSASVVGGFWSPKRLAQAMVPPAPPSRDSSPSRDCSPSCDGSPERSGLTK